MKPNTTPSLTGHTLRTLRESLRISQSQMCGILEISQPTFSRLEGSNRELDPKMAERLAPLLVRQKACLPQEGTVLDEALDLLGPVASLGADPEQTYARDLARAQKKRVGVKHLQNGVVHIVAALGHVLLPAQLRRSLGTALQDHDPLTHVDRDDLLNDKKLAALEGAKMGQLVKEVHESILRALDEERFHDIVPQARLVLTSLGAQAEPALLPFLIKITHNLALALVKQGNHTEAEALLLSIDAAPHADDRDRAIAKYERAMLCYERDLRYDPDTPMLTETLELLDQATALIEEAAPHIEEKYYIGYALLHFVEVLCEHREPKRAEKLQARANVYLAQTKNKKMLKEIAGDNFKKLFPQLTKTRSLAIKTHTVISLTAMLIGALLLILGGSGGAGCLAEHLGNGAHAHEAAPEPLLAEHLGNGAHAHEAAPAPLLAEHLGNGAHAHEAAPAPLLVEHLGNGAHAHEAAPAPLLVEHLGNGTQGKNA